MAFEAFPADAIEAFNDPGIYYVHENGKLRSPPGLGPSPRTTTYDAGLPKLSPFYISESSSDGSTCFIPRSLFQQTIDFVARNLWRVESLVGFPEIVGKQMFHAAEAQGVFANKQLRLTSLRLFVEAFNTEILSSLNVKRNHKMLDDFLDEIILFSGLQELELGGCSLGEEHDVWPHIGSMPHLQRLGLGKTGLSDEVLQKFTTPLRLMGRGPKELKGLDLSGNPKVTERSIRFIRVFHHLNALDISGCCFSTHGLKQLQSEMYLRQLEEDELDDKTLDAFCRSVENIGWASRVVQGWINESRVSAKDSLHQGCPKAKKFYSSSSRRLGFLDVSVKDTLPVSTSSQPYIRLVKDPKDRGRAYTTEVKQVDHASSKRERKGLKDSGHITSFASKRIPLEHKSAQGGEISLSDGGTSGHSMPEASNQEPHKYAPLKVEEATCPPSSKLGLKVKIKKRKRCQSDHDARKRIVPSAFEDDDRDLMNSYLKKRTDGDVDLDKTCERSKLMKAMESSNW